MAPLSLRRGPALANPPPAAGTARPGAKLTPATQKPHRTWTKTIFQAPRPRCLCLSCKRDAYCLGNLSGCRMSPPPQPSVAPRLPGTAHPMDPFGAKDGQARLSLLLRANYPSISLGKDSGDVCKNQHSLTLSPQPGINFLLTPRRAMGAQGERGRPADSGALFGRAGCGC